MRSAGDVLRVWRDSGERLLPSWEEAYYSNGNDNMGH